MSFTHLQRFVMLLPLLWVLAGCTGDSFNGGFKEQPQNYGPAEVRPAGLVLPARSAVVAPTNRVRCTTNCPVASKMVAWVWSYSFTPPEFTSFRFYGRATLNSPWALLGTNSRPEWTQWFSNAPAQFIICAAVDRDMSFDSTGRPR
jgi:hypothetical protein